VVTPLAGELIVQWARICKHFAVLRDLSVRQAWDWLSSDIFLSLAIIEMFSKMARTMLRGIRVASKQELIDRIHLYLAGDQCRPRDLSLEVQNGRPCYWLTTNRTIV